MRSIRFKKCAVLFVLFTTSAFFYSHTKFSMADAYFEDTSAELDGALTGGTVQPATNTVNIFPGATWEYRKPAEVGLDGAKLDVFAKAVGGVGCIVKDGYMVKTWGDQISKDDWASAGKPVMSTLLFFSIHEGLLDGVDALVNDWGWGLIGKDQSMTFRDLANNVSGYARGEPPGDAWAYNDIAIKLYALTLENVFQQTLDEATLQRFSPLQLEDGSLFISREGYGLFTTPRDFARIGWLWLNKGNWNGVQILPRDYFDNFMKSGVSGNLPRSLSASDDYLGIGTHGGDSDQTPYGPGIYGFHWWFNEKVGTSDMLTWPDAPADTFQANGHWGQEVLTVVPCLNMVVAARGNWGSFEPGNASSGMNQNLKLLVQAYSGVCGCGIPDTDSDGDGIPNCNDSCDNSIDSDGDGINDCNDLCSFDPKKIQPGFCGCGIDDDDLDGDGTLDCIDANDDNDGLRDGEEQGFDSNNPNYDGNGDGIADYLQGNVASFHNFNNQHYVTMESPIGTSMHNRISKDNPSKSNAPLNVEFPLGFFEVKIVGVTPGGKTTATLYFTFGQNFSTYFKYGPTPDNPANHWYEFLYDGQTGAMINGNVITLYFVDGMRGDDDLSPNGTITDIGGPGIFLDSGGGNQVVGSSGGGGGGCFILTAM